MRTYCTRCDVNLSREGTDLCLDCTERQKAERAGDIFLWTVLAGALIAGFLVITWSIWPADADPCVSYALGWDGAEVCPSGRGS